MPRGLLDVYNQYVGQPFASVAGGAIRGYLGLEKPAYVNDEAYRTAQALGNMPGIGAPAGVVRAAMNAPDALLAMGGLLGKVGAGKLAQPASKLKAPQDEALETARKNAVKMLGLPENNTAMDRARALGFESGWAHGSPRNDITALRSSRTGAQGPGVYATNYLPEASTYSQAKEGATVYPLMVRRSEALVTGRNNPYDELGVNADDELISELFGRGKSAVITTQEKTPDWLLKAGAPDMPERQHFVSVKPENFRSRFAAFDPAKINDPDILGNADPRLLALIAAGTGGGLLGYNYLSDR